MMIRRACFATLAVASLVAGNGGMRPLHAQETPQKPSDKPLIQTSSGDTPDNTAIDPDKEKAIRELILLIGAAKLGLQFIRQSVEEQRDANPQVPAAFWDRFLKKITEKEMTDIMVPIYARNYSREDIEGMITFYKSPLGQKMLSVTPQIMEESSKAGEALGQNVAADVIREMQKEEAAAAAKKTSSRPVLPKPSPSSGKSSSGNTKKPKTK